MTSFAFYDYVFNWPELQVALNELEVRLRSKGRPVAANILLRASAELRHDLEALARRMSITGTETLRDIERTTRVRPDTHGAGGPRLGDSLVVEPVGLGLVPGSIGVANEDLLDKNVPWWLTNEVGSAANLGHRLFGSFSEPGGPSAPDMGQFREHALFTPGKGDGAGGGVIVNPIPARRFIAQAVPVIDREWKAGFQAAKLRFNVKMTEALVSPV